MSRDLRARGVDLVVIDTSTPVGRMFFQILSTPCRRTACR
ncbi:MAG: hypothetical protein ACP5QO_12105 [Clostridia bacterium]